MFQPMSKNKYVSAIVALLNGGCSGTLAEWPNLRKMFPDLPVTTPIIELKQTITKSLWYPGKVEL